MYKLFLMKPPFPVAYKGHWCRGGAVAVQFARYVSVQMFPECAVSQVLKPSHG